MKHILYVELAYKGKIVEGHLNKEQRSSPLMCTQILLEAFPFSYKIKTPRYTKITLSLLGRIGYKHGFLMALT